MNRSDYLYIAIVFLLSYLVIALQFCNKEKKPIQSVIKKDSIEYKIYTVPKFVYSYSDTTVFRYIKKDSITGYNYIIKDSIIEKIDTNLIVFDWLVKKNIFIDTLQNDTNALIIITDTLYQNKIEKRTSYIKLYHHTTVDNYYISKNFYGGLVTNFNDIYLSGSYQNNNWLFTGGYSPQSNSFLIGFQHRVQIKK